MFETSKNTAPILHAIKNLQTALSSKSILKHCANKNLIIMCCFNIKKKKKKKKKSDHYNRLSFILISVAFYCNTQTSFIWWSSNMD